MKPISALAAIVFLTGYVHTPLQAQDVKQYADRIAVKDLKEYLTIIASDAMEGRQTGKRGQKMAAAFIQAHFEDIGLAGPVAGNYFQPLDLYTTVPGDIYVTSGTTRLINTTDVMYSGSDDSGGEVTVPLIFVGNGSESDFEGLDVKGKAVFMFSENEWVASSDPVTSARTKGAKMIFVCNTQKKEAFDQLAGKMKGLSRRGGLSLEKPTLSDARPGLFIVSPLVVDKLMGVEIDKLKKAASEDPKKKSIKKIKPATITYKTGAEIKVVKTENVLGYMEGSDKKDELVIVTAHYDHIGVKASGEGDLINNGADDDGSGTVAVLEMAKVFAAAKKEGHGPRRSILFMTVTGEESGLLGSEYYSEHPVFPLQSTVVDLNIDMIGRRDPNHKNSAPYLYVIGADKLSTELNTVSEAVNRANGNLIFDYTYNDQNHPDRLYYRSDHWNFAKKNIPIIFYFDGIHEDYHKPSDEVDKIEFDLYAKRVQSIFFMAWEIANRDGRVMPDAGKK